MTDHRDDEWFTTFARSSAEAAQNAMSKRILGILV
jgi:hypothetical protein